MAFSVGTHFGAKYWVNLEPCGLFCGCMTYFLLMFGMYATTYCVIIPWLGNSTQAYIHIVLFNGISILAGYSHFRAMTTDPGSVPKDALPLLNDDQENDYESNENRTERYKKYCKRCNAFKPARAHHCSMCGRCIIKMDHHCPWVNNCVGVGNHKLFLLFILYIFISCTYSLILIVGKYLACVYASHCGDGIDSHLIVIFLTIESILFGLFTLCMMGDQMTTICSNQTQIDRLKGTKHIQQQLINEVFATDNDILFQWSWLLPVPVVFHNRLLHNIIMGYRLEHDNEEESAPLLERLRDVLLKDGDIGSKNNSNHNSKDKESDLSVNNSDNDSGSGNTSKDNSIFFSNNNARKKRKILSKHQLTSKQRQQQQNVNNNNNDIEMNNIDNSSKNKNNDDDDDDDDATGSSSSTSGEYYIGNDDIIAEWLHDITDNNNDNDNDDNSDEDDDDEEAIDENSKMLSSNDASATKKRSVATNSSPNSNSTKPNATSTSKHNNQHHHRTEELELTTIETTTISPNNNLITNNNISTSHYNNNNCSNSNNSASSHSIRKRTN